jgi:UDP-glucose 4-epimerase
MRVIITGGAGFIGSHLTDLFLEGGHDVMVYDNLSVGRKEFIPLGNTKLQLLEADILDSAQIEKAVNEFNPDLVYHLAAIHFIPTCENDPVSALRINVEGSQNVFMACKNKNIRVVFTSTGAIYDPTYDAELTEDSEVNTKDIYGLTKHTAESLAEYHVMKGFGSISIARLFNAVGRRETNPHLIPAIMEQLSIGDLKVELGNLYPRRDYIHVEDIAEGLYSMRSIISEESPIVVNIGSGIEHSVGDLVKLFSEVIGKKIEIIQVASRMRKNDRPGQLAGIGKLNKLTGWKPKRNLRIAIEEILQELLNTQN